MRNGTVVFSNTSSSYSSLILNQGTLRLGATNAIPVNATVDVGASQAAFLDLAGFNQTLAAISKNANAATVTNSLAATTERGADVPTSSGNDRMTAVTDRGCRSRTAG